MNDNGGQQRCCEAVDSKMESIINRLNRTHDLTRTNIRLIRESGDTLFGVFPSTGERLKHKDVNSLDDEVYNLCNDVVYLNDIISALTNMISPNSDGRE